MNILVADDHPLIRKGLMQILSDSVYIKKVYEAGNNKEISKILKTEKIDVLILDISMPGKDGIEILKDTKIQYPHIKVLMLSIQPENQYAVRAFKYGASGCVNKASAPEELIAAIRKVHSGGRYLNDAVSEILLNNITQKASSELPHKQLSEREYQVMLLLAKGKTISEISEKLNLSIKTVSTYRTRLLAKMNLHTNSDLTYYAIKNNLISSL